MQLRPARWRKERAYLNGGFVDRHRLEAHFGKERGWAVLGYVQAFVQGYRFVDIRGNQLGPTKGDLRTAQEVAQELTRTSTQVKAPKPKKKAKKKPKASSGR